MTDYILLTISAMLFAFMFLFNRGYQRSRGTGFDVALTFAAYTCTGATLIMLILSLVGALTGWQALADFGLEFSWFSMIVAIVGAAGSVGYSFFSIKALGSANLSLYSIFAMLGGMLLPSLTGVLFFEEKLTLPKIGCYILIVIAVSLTFEKGKQGKKALFYYFGVFVLNGMSGVISMIQQSNREAAVNSVSFMVMKSAACVVICVALFAMIYKKFPSLRLNECGNVSAYALCNGIGNLLLLIALLNVDATVQFPIITGGTMFFSTVVSMIIGEKPGVKTIIASVIAAASTVLMMF